MSGALSGDSTYTTVIVTIPFGKMLRQTPGGAYLLTVTTRRIRLHLDNVPKAFYALARTGPFLKPT
jgi:hypothetical protein